MGKPGGKKEKHTSEKTNDDSERHKTKEPIPKATDEDEAIFIARSQELKEEGNKMFQKKDHGGAVYKYENALKLLPSFHIDRAYLHSNIAACYMQLTPPEYDRAISECNLALQVSSRYSKALLKRARCYEALERPDLALMDVSKVLNMEAHNVTALEISERLKENIEKKGLKISDKKVISEEVSNSYGPQKVKRVVQSQTNLAKGVTKKKKRNKAQDKPVLEEKSQDKHNLEDNSRDEVAKSVKLVFDDDIRWAKLPSGCSISQLRDIIKSCFPCLTGFLVKYKDQDGDLVTITITEELRWAEESVDPQGLLRLFVFEVKPEQDPLFEELNGEADVENPTYARNNHHFDNGNLAKDSECKVHVSTWIVHFAQMFKNHVGIDFDAYLDLHELGMKLYSDAMEDVVTCEEAQDLFDIAANKFQEMTALALLNWGNIYMSKARKRVVIEEDESNEALLAQAKGAYEWSQREYEKAGKRYEESLKIKSDFYEGFLALGQQQFEQAKLNWYFAIGTKVDLDDWDASQTIELFNSAEDNMEQGAHIWEEMEGRRLNELKTGSKPNNEKVLLQKLGFTGTLKELSADEAAEQATNVRSQINLLWGTMLYERSVIEFKLGLDTWQECFFAAVDKFKLAGASPTDIAVMEKNHCSNATAQEGLGFKIDEIVQAWNEIYDAKRWTNGVPSFRLEPLFRQRVPKLLHVLEHLQ